MYGSGYAILACCYIELCAILVQFCIIELSDVVFVGPVPFSLSTNALVHLSIRGSQSVICINNSNAKVN